MVFDGDNLPTIGLGDNFVLFLTASFNVIMSRLGEIWKIHLKKFFFARGMNFFCSEIAKNLF